MNIQLESLMYLSGLTAQGSFDDMDEYNKAAILKFAELIVRECIESVKEDMYSGAGCHSDFSTGGDWALETAINNIKEKFGVQP